MYPVYSSRWNKTRIIGQERLLADAWLESVSDDTSPVSWSPLFSVVQLFHNLIQILDGIATQTLNRYHLKHGCEELLARLDEGTWLDEHLQSDMPFMKEKLRWGRDRTGETSDDVLAQAQLLSFLKAFVAKLEATRPWEVQVKMISRQVADPGCRFALIVRAVSELTNDLMHEGHSRAHLHRWMLKTIVGSASEDSYLEVFSVKPYLREKRKGFDVLLQVASPLSVGDTNGIMFLDKLPSDWAVDPTSPMATDSRSRFAIVCIENARDPFAAIAYARAKLSRYLWSIKFHQVEFDRALSNHAAVRQHKETYVTHEAQPRDLNQHGLWNSERLERVDLNVSNPQTYQALDRILYWIEQTRRVEPVAALISEWTAMEFLFSVQELRDLDAVVKYVPAYLCPKLPRLLLLDFWSCLWQVRPTIPDDLGLRIDMGTKAHPGAKPSCDLTKLFEVCLEPEAGNPLKPLITDYPILQYKFHRVRRMKPGTSSLIEDVNRFRDRLVFDIRTCYRARNTVVHDAAMTVTENLRMLQRLNWMLCTCVDSVIFTYSRNSSLSLIDVHRCIEASWDKWQEVIADKSNPCPVEQVIEPPIYFTA